MSHSLALALLEELSLAFLFGKLPNLGVDGGGAATRNLTHVGW
jgi:hypothetical protein